MVYNMNMEYSSDIPQTTDPNATLITASKPDQTLIASIPDQNATVVAMPSPNLDATQVGLPINIALADLKPRVSMDLKPWNHYILAEQTTKNYLLSELNAWFEGGVQNARSPLSIALVLDKSGSMEGKPWEQVKLAVRQIVDLLTPADRLAVVVFDEHVETILPCRPVIEKEALKRVLDSIKPKGTTNLFAGMVRGAELLKAASAPGVIERVILLTDGDVNEGITEYADLVNEVRTIRAGGQSVTTLGMGIEFNEELLTALAKNSGGNYYYVESPDMLVSLFANEINSMFRVVAKNVRYRLRLPSGCKVTRSYGLEWYQRSISTGLEARFEITDLEAQIKQQILVELEFDSMPDRSTIDIDAELSFEYFGQTNRTEITGVLRFEATRDKQLIFSNVNKDVEAVMRMRDVVAKIKQATQLIDRDNSSATMILDQARTQLLSVGRNQDATLIAGSLDKLKSGQNAEATKVLSQGVFGLELDRTMSLSIPDLNAGSVKPATDQSRINVSSIPIKPRSTSMTENQESASIAENVSSELLENKQYKYFLQANDIEYPLFNGSIDIGRSTEGITIPDGYMSRRHVQIVTSDEGVLVIDLGSSNGTYIDEVKLEANTPTKIQVHQKLKVGKTELILHLYDETLEPALDNTGPIDNKDIPDNTEISKDIVDSEPLILAEDQPADSIITEVSENIEGNDVAKLSGVEVAAISPETSPTSPQDISALAKYFIENPQLPDGCIEISVGKNTVVGRTLENADIAINFDPYMSRRHFEILITSDGSASITDLKSSNCTFIDSDQLEPNIPKPIRPGQKIKAGQTEFKFTAK